MTKEDKILLIKDLSARLPYAVIVEHTSGFRGKLHDLTAVHLYDEDDIKDIDCGTHFFGDEDWYRVEYFKPYLFPLSSMTDEQRKEWQSLMIKDSYGILYYTPESFDYLYKNHIDIRGFIPKGLAIDATNLNIY